MIHKEKNSTLADTPTARAGDGAERQMAFYLRRRFAEVPNIHVFNDLRLTRRGEVAQIDHLILHRHGLIIIESKSVTGEVRINEQLEFTRHSRGRAAVGMPSPIQQAKRQGELLRRLLIDHKETLRDRKLLGLVQGGFKYTPIQILVAVSDNAIIKRPRAEIPELHKADQVVDQAQAIIDRHAKAAKLTTKFDDGWGEYFFAPDETTRVIRFLLEQHAPTTSESQAAAAPVEEVAKSPTPRAETRQSAPARKPPTYVCTHCHGTRLEVRYGRSYYFKCLECDGNTPIKNACPTCGKRTRTKKRGDAFSSVCEVCGDAGVFYSNT